MSQFISFIQGQVPMDQPTEDIDLQQEYSVINCPIQNIIDNSTLVSKQYADAHYSQSSTGGGYPDHIQYPNTGTPSTELQTTLGTITASISGGGIINFKQNAPNQISVLINEPISSANPTTKNYVDSNFLVKQTLNQIAANQSQTADINFNNYNGVNLSDPVLAQQIATKNYVDTHNAPINQSLQQIYNNTPSDLDLNSNAFRSTYTAIANNELMNKLQLDQTYMPITETLHQLSNLNLNDGFTNQNNFPIINLQDPTNNQDAVTKSYLNTSIGNLSTVYMPISESLDQISSNNPASASISANSQKIVNLQDPSALQDALTLNYFNNHSTTTNQTLAQIQAANPTPTFSIANTSIQSTQDPQTQNDYSRKLYVDDQDTTTLNSAKTYSDSLAPNYLASTSTLQQIENSNSGNLDLGTNSFSSSALASTNNQIPNFQQVTAMDNAVVVTAETYTDSQLANKNYINKTIGLIEQSKVQCENQDINFHPDELSISATNLIMDCRNLLAYGSGTTGVHLYSDSLDAQLYLDFPNVTIHAPQNDVNPVNLGFLNNSLQNYTLNTDGLQEIQNRTPENLDMTSHSVSSSFIPNSSNILTNKSYVDSAISTAGSGYLPSYSSLDAIQSANPNNLDMSSYSLRITHTPVVSSDVINKGYADSNYVLQTTPLQNITLPTANLSMNSHKITNLALCTNANDAANKSYVDSAVSGGSLPLNTIAINNPTSGDIDFNGYNAINVLDPTTPQQIATKNYVDVNSNSIQNNKLTPTTQVLCGSSNINCSIGGSTELLIDNSQITIPTDQLVLNNTLSISAANINMNNGGRIQNVIDGVSLQDVATMNQVLNKNYIVDQYISPTSEVQCVTNQVQISGTSGLIMENGVIDMNNHQIVNLSQGLALDSNAANIKDLKQKSYIQDLYPTTNTSSVNCNANQVQIRATNGLQMFNGNIDLNTTNKIINSANATSSTDCPNWGQTYNQIQNVLSGVPTDKLDIYSNNLLLQQQGVPNISFNRTGGIQTNMQCSDQRLSIQGGSNYLSLETSTNFVGMVCNDSAKSIALLANSTPEVLINCTSHNNQIGLTGNQYNQAIGQHQFSSNSANGLVAFVNSPNNDQIQIGNGSTTTQAQITTNSPNMIKLSIGDNFGTGSVLNLYSNANTDPTSSKQASISSYLTYTMTSANEVLNNNDYCLISRGALSYYLLNSTPPGQISAFFVTYGNSPSLLPNWLPLNGSTYSSSTYPKLFTILGTTTLPDFRSRYPKNGDSLNTAPGTLNSGQVLTHTHPLSTNATCTSGTHTHGVGTFSKPSQTATSTAVSTSFTYNSANQSGLTTSCVTQILPTGGSSTVTQTSHSHSTTMPAIAITGVSATNSAYTNTVGGNTDAFGSATNEVNNFIAYYYISTGKYY